MFTEYGHAEIRWQDTKYILSPSFINIAKLGSPKEIIDDFKIFVEASAVWKFIIATSVLNACSDKEIPESLIGKVKFSDKQQRFMYVKPSHDLDMFNDVIVLAEHLLLHGICGKVEKKSKGGGERLEEFDAYEYMEIARINLEQTPEQASNMTMTEFIRLANRKFPPEKSDAPDEELDSQLLDWFNNENNGVH